MTICETCKSNEFCKSNATCEPCLKNCASCRFGIVCSQCEIGFFSKFADAVNTCSPCSESADLLCSCRKVSRFGCSECENGDCVRCESEKQMVCVSQCLSNEECGKGLFCNFDDNGVNTCLDCKNECLKCSSLTQCDLCPSGKFSINGTCLDCSMIGKGDSCQCDEKLIPDCMKCGMGGVCAACSGEFILVSGQCIKVACSETVLCETGQFCQIIPNTLNKCVDCGSGCGTCDQTACQSCLADFKLVGGQCLKNQCDDEIACQAGFFCQIGQSAANTCMDCSLFPDECKKKDVKTDIVPIIVGVVVGLVVFLILIILIILFIKKRKSQNQRDCAILGNNSNVSYSSSIYEIY